MDQDRVDQAIAACSAHHRHLCPRQILGVRMGLFGAASMGLAAHNDDKRILAIVESDGCVSDGISAATGCTVGHRTLRIEDYGKVAATFVDVPTERALRISPRLDVRQRAWAYAPGEPRRYFAQLQAYRVMPDEELLAAQEVQLAMPVRSLVSQPGLRVNCARCGEEIINEREILVNGETVCRGCSGRSYYLDRLPWSAVILVYAQGEK